MLEVPQTLPRRTTGQVQEAPTEVSATQRQHAEVPVLARAARSAR